MIIFNKKETSFLLKNMLVLNILVTLFCIVAPTYELLLIARFLMGLAGNCYSVLATMTIASLSPKEKVGKNLSLSIAGAAFALMIGVPLTRELVALYSWKVVFMGLIFIMLLSLMYFIFFLPKDEQLNLSQTPDGTLELVSKTILSAMCIIAPQVFIVFSDLIPDIAELKQEICKNVSQNYIPDILKVDNVLEYILLGQMVLCAQM